MRITDRLNAENGLLLKQLDVLDELARAGSPGTAAVAKAIARAIEGHLTLQEDHLYPALRRIALADADRVEELLIAHRATGLLVGIVAEGDVPAPVVEEFRNAVRQQIEREIHWLFPLAETRLAEGMLAPQQDWYEEHVHERAGRTTRGPAKLRG